MAGYDDVPPVSIPEKIVVILVVATVVEVARAHFFPDKPLTTAQIIGGFVFNLAVTLWTKPEDKKRAAVAAFFTQLSAPYIVGIFSDSIKAVGSIIVTTFKKLLEPPT